MSNDYLLQLHIEQPGTDYHGQPSTAGHVWYEVIAPDGTTFVQAGFGPVGDKTTLLPVQGEVYFNDGAAYAGDPYFTATYRITLDQATTLDNYARNPDNPAYGFDKNTYWAPTNSCVDFVWKGLNLIGMNPSGNEGAVMPVNNVAGFSALTNPAFADGGLVNTGLSPTLLNSVVFNTDNTVHDWYQQGIISNADNNAWNDWMSNTLTAPTQQIIPFVAGYNPADPYGFGPSLDPIGAFYETVTPALDLAPSIADKTPVLVAANNQGLTVAALTSRDANHDGMLSGAELNNLNVWTDLNEDGLNDAGELKTLTELGITQIKSADYDFYTQGNAVSGAGISAEPVHPVETNGMPTVVDSNYRTLRDTDNTYIYYANGGTYFISWTASQIKVNFQNKSYLIGTDGADTFDANYYSATPSYIIDSSLLTNFLAGGGDDVFGGSTRADNLWGGLGNDTAYGYAGDDKLHGEECNDQLQGGEGNVCNAMWYSTLNDAVRRTRRAANDMWRIAA